MVSMSSDERRRAEAAEECVQSKSAELDQLQAQLEVSHVDLTEANESLASTREQLESAQVDAERRLDTAKCEMQSMEAAAAATAAQHQGNTNGKGSNEEGLSPCLHVLCARATSVRRLTSLAWLR